MAEVSWHLRCPRGPHSKPPSAALRQLRPNRGGRRDQLRCREVPKVHSGPASQDRCSTKTRRSPRGKLRRKARASTGGFDACMPAQTTQPGMNPRVSFEVLVHSSNPRENCTEQNSTTYWRVHLENNSQEETSARMILLNSCLYFPVDERQNSKEKLTKIKCDPYQHAFLRGARYKIWHKAVRKQRLHHT